jgi:hypothetical protein
VQHTHRQYTLPASGKTSAYKANRAGGAERFGDPAVQKSLAGELALLTYDAARLGAVARPIIHTAKHHDANPLSLRQTVPGIGTILRLVLLYAMHDIHRFPRGQALLSSCRLVKCAKASAGKRLGTAGAKSGKAQRKGAFSEAAVVFLRDHPAAQTSLARLEKRHGTGNALTVLAQKVARAVSSMRKRHGAFARETCFQRSGRRADEPGAELDNDGMTLQEALATAACTASVNAKAPIGQAAPSPAPLLGHPLALLCDAVRVANGLRVLLLTRAGLSLASPLRVAPPVHRTVRGHKIISRSQRLPTGSLQSSPR